MIRREDVYDISLRGSSSRKEEETQQQHTRVRCFISVTSSVCFALDCALHTCVSCRSMDKAFIGFIDIAFTMAFIAFDIWTNLDEGHD